MTVQRETLLCRYQYDPLDRVVNCAPLNQDSVQRFYRKNRLSTEFQGPVRYSVFEHESQLMAQQQREAGRIDCALLATDLQRSALHSVAVGEHQRPVYAPYGHRSPESGLSCLLGFNGERRDPVTGHYLLGNGYRAFNPVLMRFNSPDSLSPFGKGGVNAYAYCAGDPVNRVDPTGHVIQALTQWIMPRKIYDAFFTAAVSKVRKFGRQAAEYADTWRPSYKADQARHAHKMAKHDYEVKFRNLKTVEQYPALVTERAAAAQNQLKLFDGFGIGPDFGAFREAEKNAHFANLNLKNLANHPAQLQEAQSAVNLAFNNERRLAVTPLYSEILDLTQQVRQKK